MAPKGYVLNESEARDFNRMRAERRRRGPPKARRQPRRRMHGGVTLSRDLVNSYGGPWTIAEYDPDTGSIIRTMDRGRRRQTNTISKDVAILLAEDGDHIYAAGVLDINEADGEVVKWNINNYSRQWNSAKGSKTPTVFSDITSGFASVRPYGPILEASDGFIWTCFGRGVGSDTVSRINPTTGAQTHEFAVSSGILQLMKADSSGGVVAASITATGGKYMRVLDATAAETASYSTAIVDVYESGGILVTVEGGPALRTLNADDLTSIVNRGAPSDASSFLSACHDGTHVYTASTTKYFKYDMATLATEVWASAARGHNNSHALKMHPTNGHFYDCAFTGGSNTVGGIYKVAAADGVTAWSYTTQGSVFIRTALAFGTDFVVFIGFTNGGYNIYCLEDSDGSVRWNDFWTQPYGLQVTSDDRIFVCGPRYGP